VGLFSNAEVRQIPPTLRSVWLVFHITFAKLSAAAFVLSLAAAILQLARARGMRWRWLGRAPGADVLDACTVRFVGFGFLFWTVTIAAGAIWANQSWGRYWGWDLIETWSLISWLTYGIFLHARIFFRLRHVATAWSSVGAFAIFVLTLLILPFLMPSMHSASSRSAGAAPRDHRRRDRLERRAAAAAARSAPIPAPPPVLHPPLLDAEGFALVQVAVAAFFG
jgi:ABC-type transport system involved in cytochrome c biogenesis permease subunit